ncbi:MAG: aminotransferase class IV [Pseudomonadota bacterium]
MTHDYLADPRNADILISVNGDLVPREKAVVSVFDSGFLLGDGVWEGLRVTNGGIAFLSQHLDRLYAGAKTLDFDVGLDRAGLRARLFACLEANGMNRPEADGVHIRLMVTRGLKSTPYQDPRVTIGPATIVIVAEYKTPDPGLLSQGVRLFTVHQRRTAPDMQDQKLNSHSKLNCILACIQATKAGFDEALMLDTDGCVATCNSTHFFIVRDGEVWTSDGVFCLGGITRGNVLRVARDNGVTARETRFTLHDVYSADEAFITGTFAGLIPVVEIDGRTLPRLGDDSDASGPVTRRLRALYKMLQHDMSETPSSPAGDADVRSPT